MPEFADLFYYVQKNQVDNLSLYSDVLVDVRFNN